MKITIFRAYRLLNDGLDMNGSDITVKESQCCLTLKAPITTKAEFANTVDPDEMAHHLDP